MLPRKIAQINPWPVRQYERKLSQSSKTKFQHLLQKFHHRQPNHELIIIVDGTALFYRRGFSYLKERSTQANSSSSSNKSSKSSSSSSSSSLSKKKFLGLESDPTRWLHSNITHTLRFLHSVIPFGDGDETFQPDVVPLDLVIEGMKCGCINHSGGLMKAEANSLAYLAKMRGQELPLILHEESSPMFANAFNMTKNDDDQHHQKSILKRKIMFCFDHGGRKNIRHEVVTDYKGQRPKRCGRIVSFVNYAIALTRQLADNSPHLVHGVFPAGMKPVELLSKRSNNNGDKNKNNKKKKTNQQNDDEETLMIDSPKTLLKYMMMNSKKRRTKKDPFLKSIFEATTIQNPFTSLPAISGEADDAVYTLVKHYADLNKRYNHQESSSKKSLPRYSIMIVSSDKDLMQLLEFPNTYFFNMNSNAFISRREVCEKKFCGIETPGQISDLLTLSGDTIDNVPGIPNTGSKRAAKLIRRFGSVEGLISAVKDAKEEKKNENTNNKNNKSKTNKNGCSSGDGYLRFENDSDKHQLMNENNSNNNKPSIYERAVTDYVDQNSEFLLNVKHKVIALRELPWVKKAIVKQATSKKSDNNNKNQNNNNNRRSSFTGFAELDRQGVFRGQNAFRRVGAGSNEEGYDDNLLASSKRVSESMWRLIREYYSKYYGVCNEKNEDQHHCGIKKK